MFEQLHPSVIIGLEILYILFIILVCLRVIYDTRSVPKTLAYLLLVIFLPIIGTIFYFTFGINYRKRKIYNRKLIINDKEAVELKQRFQLFQTHLKYSEHPLFQNNKKLIHLMNNSLLGHNPLFVNNEIDLLDNGEVAFPQIINDLKNAQHHIHVEYYIYENDTIGNQIKDILIEKVRNGVEVRFIYDDFGSRNIRKNIVKELENAGVEVFPFYKIKMIYVANRMNYRNHRKIIIIDGAIAYTGGINVCDKYINSVPNTGKLYWRDTHIKIQGAGAYALQRIFLSDWNFCSGQEIQISNSYFPLISETIHRPDSALQIVSSGPDSDTPAILYAVIKAIYNAKEEILITTPYYIPDEKLQEALILAALSGVHVKLLIPGISDSKFVNWASESYFDELLDAGVEIYRYQKGFVHSKLLIIDNDLASVGTANLDLRSFDLNFEVNAFIYDTAFNEKIKISYFNDLKDAQRIVVQDWKKRSKARQLLIKLVRLISPFL